MPDPPRLERPARDRVLEELVRNEMLATYGQTYRIRHAMLRDALLGSMPEGRSRASQRASRYSS